jgi:hypothetical protein
VEGRQPDRHNWFTHVQVKAKQPVGV